MKKIITLFFVASALIAISFAPRLEAASVPMQVIAHEGKSGYFAPGSTTWNPVQMSQPVEAGGKIKTWANGKVCVCLSEQGAARFLTKTVGTIEKMEADKKSRAGSFQLESGSLLLSLNATDLPNSDFKIKTPQGSAAARGTTYLAGVEGVTVLEGKVRFTKNNGRNVTLTSGYSLLNNGSVVLDKVLLKKAYREFEAIAKGSRITGGNYRRVRRAVQIALIYQG
jgi:hypothetical protein